MTQAAAAERSDSLILNDLLPTCAQACQAAETLRDRARDALAQRVVKDGRVSGRLLNEHQYAAHGFAWLATYVATLRATFDWGEKLRQRGALGELEQLMIQCGFGEYLHQIAGGIPMSQTEIIRLDDIGAGGEPLAEFADDPAVTVLTGSGNSDKVRMRITELLREHYDQRYFGDVRLGDETLDLVRDQFRKVGDDYAAAAHEWHREDRLIPDEVVNQLAELGVFGLTVPEDYGGLGMGKLAMAVVSEELSRGFVGLGSLGTRSEIAAELVRLGGTDAQKDHYLPKIASGEIIPTAVFTEPNVGSDLGSIRTRAIHEGEVYKIRGNKTWITHGGRSDLMTLLARTDPNETGYKGLSMFLAEKPRGDDDEPFPHPRMDGGQIKTLGYRGMHSYEIAFDDFEVPAENLLGGEEGQGFKHLMATFESARIQTAARAVGVAQSAVELGLGYAMERKQFGRPIADFSRIGGKVALSAVETMMSRQLTYAAANEKDSDRRCDIEAGMAKLVAARVAWSAADNAVQIHGGNGYAEEYPVSRVLVDSRILNVFEGAAEIQATVVARGLLSQES